MANYFAALGQIVSTFIANSPYSISSVEGDKGTTTIMLEGPVKQVKVEFDLVEEDNTLTLIASTFDLDYMRIDYPYSITNADQAIKMARAFAKDVNLE